VSQPIPGSQNQKINQNTSNSLIVSLYPQILNRIPGITLRRKIIKIPQKKFFTLQIIRKGE